LYKSIPNPWVPRWSIGKALVCPDVRACYRVAMVIAQDRANFEGLTQAEAIDQLAQRQVVALYDNTSKTIFLPDDGSEHRSVAGALKEL